MKKGVLFVGFVLILFTIHGVFAASDIKQASSDLINRVDTNVERNVDFSPGAYQFFNTIYRLGDQVISFSYLIVLLCLTGIVFYVIYQVASFSPFLDKFPFVFSILITGLIAISGGMKEFLNVFYGNNLFRFLDEHPTLRLIIFVFILIAILLLSSKLFRKLRKIKEKLEAENNGRKLGMGIVFGEIMSRAMQEMAKPLDK